MEFKDRQNKAVVWCRVLENGKTVNQELTPTPLPNQTPTP